MNDKQTDQIVLSEAAYAKLISKSPEANVEAIGTVQAKGVGPLRLFRLEWRESPVESPKLRLAALSADARAALPQDADDTRGVHALFVDPLTGRGYIRPVYVKVTPSATPAIRCRSDGGRVMQAAAERAVRAAFAALDGLGFTGVDLNAHAIEWWIDGTPAHYDGASAALAIALAAVAAFAGVSIDATVAVTGAVDGDRAVKVAGVASKWAAVRDHGFETILLPADDRAELPPAAFAAGGPQVIFVATLSDAIVDLLGPALGLAARRLEAATAPRDFATAVELDLWVEPAGGTPRDIAVVPRSEAHSWRSGDAIRICCRASRDCHLALINIGPTGNPTVLIPNRMRTDAELRAGELWTFPAADDRFEFRLSGPVGREQVIALACATPPHLTPDVFRQTGAAFAVPTTRDIAIVERAVEPLVLARKTVEFYVSSAGEISQSADNAVLRPPRFRSIDVE